MSSSPRARSKSRASSVRAIARKSRDPAEWKPWFSPGFTVLGERLSESSEQSDRISLFSHFDSPPPAGIVQSTETEGRLRFTRTHLAREAHKKRRHQSTRATSEDVTLACGSPTPTVREPAKHRHKTPASWRLSMTKSVSVIPPLSPFSESLNPALFSDDHGELCSLSQFSQASSFPPPEQPREASRVSEVPSLSRSSTYYYSASPATGPRGASGESQSSFPGPSSPELAFNRQLSETLVPRSEKSRTLGSSPIPSQPFSPPIQYRDTTGAGSLGSTSGMIPNGAHSPLGLVSGHSLPNPGIREPSDGGVSKLGLRDLCSYIASGPPGVSQADICERWLKEKTSYLLESYKKILPTLWDEKDEMFQSRYKEREDLKKFCHRTAQEEMQDGLDLMRWGNSKPFHQPSPPANDRLAPAVAISSVNRHEGELRAARTANQFPEAIVSSGRNSEQGGRPALEASNFDTEVVQMGEPAAGRVQQRAWSRPQQHAQSTARKRARSLARQRAKARARQRTRSRPPQPARSRARQMDPRLEKNFIVGRDPAYDYSTNRPVHEQRWRILRRYTPNTRRLKEDQKLIRGLSTCMRHGGSESQAKKNFDSGRRQAVLQADEKICV